VSFYLIDDLEQGSREWHAWRKGVIGASDAPKIMGENPWGSRSSLLDEKLGLVREFQGNAKTREGNSFEGDARKSLESKYKMKLKPGFKRTILGCKLGRNLQLPRKSLRD